MAKSLKEKTVTSLIWSSVGKFGGMIVSFISNLILARLLMPSDFGYIGVLYVFIAISQIFINGGFASALIQKKNPTDLDYTTVFYWNLVVSLLFIGIIYFTAPLIAGYYDMPLLTNILRVLSTVLIFSSISLIQTTQLQKNLQFKQLSIRSLIASTIGVSLAIVMAFQGYGVWSLVGATLLTEIVSSILLWKMSIWRPTLNFSMKSFKELFSFGGLMLLSSLTETLYNNIQILIIGKYFSIRDLGFFSQAKKMEEMPSSALSTIVNQVTFPVFSKLQDNTKLLHETLRKNTIAISFINFPLMVFLIVIGQSLFIMLYTDRWIESVPYFQILCISGMLYALNVINLNMLKSLGKSKLYFYVQFFKRTIGLGMIFYGLNFGIYGMLWAIVLFNYLSFFINAYITGRLIGFGIGNQIKSVMLNYILSVAVGIIVYFIMDYLILGIYLNIIISLIIYCVLYLFSSHLFRSEGLVFFIEIISNKIKIRNG